MTGALCPFPRPSVQNVQKELHLVLYCCAHLASWSSSTATEAQRTVLCFTVLWQVTVEESLLKSLNVPTVKLCAEIGVDKVRGGAENAQTEVLVLSNSGGCVDRLAESCVLLTSSTCVHAESSIEGYLDY